MRRKMRDYLPASVVISLVWKGMGRTAVQVFPEGPGAV